MTGDAAAAVNTRESLTRQFQRLGVRPADTLLVHCSMRKIGWVCGGVTALAQALLDAVGPAGSIVVPTHTLENRDPSRWRHRPVPPEWWPAIRRHLPAYQPELSPSTGMGALAERIRTWPGSVRSGHPLTSFAAVGGRARKIVAEHRLDSLLGDHSPLAALERMAGRVLLLGVGFERCTAFHLAEPRLPDRPQVELAAVMVTENGREWVRYRTDHHSDHDFGDLGAAYEAAYGNDGSLSRGMVGASTGRLFPLREAVRFAERWLTQYRASTGHPGPGPSDESEKR